MSTCLDVIQLQSSFLSSKLELLHQPANSSLVVHIAYAGFPSTQAPSWSMALQRFTRSCFAEVAFDFEAQGQPYRSTCSSFEHDHLASQVTRRTKPKQRARGTNDVIPKPAHGNFQRYYHIHNPTTADNDNDAADENSVSHPALALDSRVAAILSFLTAHYAHTGSVATSSVGEEETRVFSVLDIGCNSGKLTIQLTQTLPALLRKVSGDGTGVEIIGVDIDPKLIGQAKKAAGNARSLHRPPKLSSEEGVAGGEQLPTEAVFFPSCFPALFGPLESAANDDERGAKGRRASTAHLEPRLLRFIAAEWVHPSPATSSSFHYSLHSLSHLTNLDKRKYSTILALSITKWIHIQQSDSGLTLFFARLSSTLLPGGLLFLERQEWKSYSTAKNLDAGMKGKIKGLQMRPGGDFDLLLEKIGFRLMERIGWGRGKGFERPLQVFCKVGGQQEEELVRQVLERGARFDWVCKPPDALE
ncbi:uncharacterized protein UBRO_01193 [Ustilago bromivora]|uniref:RNA methyltransferase n=1 Tax=Ustilago bromivora TaxID=307758 RepID=A0A1K0GGN4_9BASI|nr:uncharacterized protein UBRO_01193 [Ustilago bromivora]